MKKVDLTKGNVARVVTSLAIPIMISSILQFAYNFIDMLWVGGLGSEAVGIIGTSSFFIGVGFAIQAFINIGVGIEVSHGLGSKDDRNVREYINVGWILNIIVGLGFLIVIFLFGRNLIGIFKLNDLHIENSTYDYLLLNALVLVIAFFNTLFIRILNSYGNNKSALYISAIGIVINIVLDPIFIYVFEFGVIGAGIATLIATIVMFIIFMINGKAILRYDFSVKVRASSFKTVILLGLPMSTQRVIFTSVNIILGGIIANYGIYAIAAHKVGLQIESITFMVIGGLSGGVASFVGQNYGAKREDRINDGYRVAMLIGIIYAGLMSLVFILSPKPLVTLFVDDVETVKIASSYLKIIGLAQIFSAVEIIGNGYFTGIGRPKIPGVISIVFTVLRIPMAIVFVSYAGVNGVWVSLAISSILKGIATYCVGHRLKSRRVIND